VPIVRAMGTAASFRNSTTRKVINMGNIIRPLNILKKTAMGNS